MSNERINLIMITARALRDKVAEEGLDKAYDWFMEYSKTEFTPREQMHIVLLAGGIRECVEQEFKEGE